MKIDRQLGFLVLGIWLILMGLNEIVGLRFNGMPILLGALAIISGGLLVLRK